MKLQKEKPADVAASTGQETKHGTDIMIILQHLFDVNDDSVTCNDLYEWIGIEGITEELRSYIAGRLYDIRKGDVGHNQCERNPDGTFIPNANTPMKNGRYLETADYVAKDLGCATSTVKRNGQYSKGIDAIKRVDPRSAEAILLHKKVVSKVNIVAIGAADPDAQDEMISALVTGKPVYADRSVKKTKKRREDLSRIAECVSSLFCGTENEYTINSLCREIRMNAEPFVEMLRQKIEQNKELCAKHKTAVMRALIESVIYKIEDIEEEIRNYE